MTTYILAVDTTKCEEPELTPAQHFLMNVGTKRYVLCDGGLAFFVDRPDGEFSIKCNDVPVFDTPKGCYEEDGQVFCVQEFDNGN
jgi:hypothetical protein